MATVSGPPTSLNSARAVFGAGPGSLNALRRGAGLVPDVSVNSNVPTGSPIALSQLIGATNAVPIVVSHSPPAFNSIIINEPAPANTNVSTSTNLSISGGVGPTTVTWSRTSGSTALGVPANNEIHPSWSATVVKNGTVTANFNAAVTDGVSTTNHQVTVTLQYSNNA